MSDSLLELMHKLRPRAGVCRLTMSGSMTWMETWEPGSTWQRLTADSDAFKTAERHKTEHKTSGNTND